MLDGRRVPERSRAGRIDAIMAPVIGLQAYSGGLTPAGRAFMPMIILGFDLAIGLRQRPRAARHWSTAPSTT